MAFFHYSLCLEKSFCHFLKQSLHPILSELAVITDHCNYCSIADYILHYVDIFAAERCVFVYSKKSLLISKNAAVGNQLSGISLSHLAKKC